jgi:N-acetyl-alpha-D-muramate 1-phosphate uridylyltransferase
MENNTNITAIIFAAGLGTRLKPFTDSNPKALAMVNGKPLLQHNIIKLRDAGITTIVVNVHHFADKIISFLQQNNNFGCTILISHETPNVLETGGGLVFAAHYFTTANVLIVNCDILSTIDYKLLIQQHINLDNDATLAVSNRASSRNLLFDAHDNLVGWCNTTSNETKLPIPCKVPISKAFSGIHVIKTSLISCIKQQGKFSMIDVYLDVCTTLIIKAYDHSSDILIDVGKPEAITKAELYFK